MFNANNTKLKMSTALDHFTNELNKVRTGRAHPDMLNSVQAETYGQCMPINQIANITVSGGTMLVVQPYDTNNIKAISDAIRADQALGLNPSDDGKIIRVPIPPLTEERRREIVKTTSAKVENAKIAIRKIRDDARKEIKNLELPQDEQRKAEAKVDDMTKEYNTQIEDLFKQKESEIMKV